MNLTPDEAKKLFHEVLDERRKMSEAKHTADHEFVDLLRDRYAAEELRKERRQEVWNNVKVTAIGTATVVVVSGIGSALYWIGKVVVKSLHIKVGGGP